LHKARKKKYWLGKKSLDVLKITKINFHAVDQLFLQRSSKKAIQDNYHLEILVPFLLTEKNLSKIFNSEKRLQTS